MGGLWVCRWKAEPGSAGDHLQRQGGHPPNLPPHPRRRFSRTSPGPRLTAWYCFRGSHYGNANLRSGVGNAGWGVPARLLREREWGAGLVGGRRAQSQARAAESAASAPGRGGRAHVGRFGFPPGGGEGGLQPRARPPRWGHLHRACSLRLITGPCSGLASLSSSPFLRASFLRAARLPLSAPALCSWN